MQNLTSSFHAETVVKVSVIIATYNTAQYLAQAIESVLAQTFSQLELIIIDDGSRDHTQALVASYSDPRLTYYYQVNQGQTAAKNRGLSLSRGEFIAFCDADDFWHPQKLEWQMPYFNHSKIGVVYSEVQTINSKGDICISQAHEQRFSGEVTHPLMIENFVPFGTAVFRRDCYTQQGGFNLAYKMGIDWDLWLRYSLNWSFAYCPEKTYIYRIWEGQMSSNHKGRYFYARHILRNFIQQHRQHLKTVWIRHAWSDMNIKEANILWCKNKKRLVPFSLYIKGLCYRPFYCFGWKSFIKFLLGRR